MSIAENIEFVNLKNVLQKNEFFELYERIEQNYLYKKHQFYYEDQVVMRRKLGASTIASFSKFPSKKSLTRIKKNQKKGKKSKKGTTRRNLETKNMIDEEGTPSGLSVKKKKPALTRGLSIMVFEEIRSKQKVESGFCMRKSKEFMVEVLLTGVEYLTEN